MNKQFITVEVPIPGADLKTIVRTIQVEVVAKWSEGIGDYLLDGEARTKIERAKAREMGVLLPEQIKDLRERLGLTQKQMSELLRIGAKTWSRWETERERPSHSMNILLRALDDGKLDIPYLRGLQGKTPPARSGAKLPPRRAAPIKRRSAEQDSIQHSGSRKAEAAGKAR